MADNETSISGEVQLSVDDKASKSIENIQKKTDKAAKSFEKLGEKADAVAKSAKEIDTGSIQENFEKTADAAENLGKKINKTFGGKAKRQLQTFLLDVEDLAIQLKKVSETSFAGWPLNSSGKNSKQKKPHANTDDWSDGIPSGLDNKEKKRIAAYLRGEHGYKNPIPENVSDTERVIAYNSVRDIGKGHTAQAEMPSLQLLEKAFDEVITPALKTSLLVQNQKQRYADILKYSRELFPGAETDERISKASLENERVLADASRISQEALGNALARINDELESGLQKTIRQQLYKTEETSGILGARDKLSKNIDLDSSSDILRFNASQSSGGEKSILESIREPQKILDQYGNEIGEKTKKILTSLDLLKESIDIAKTQFSKVGKTISESDAVKAMDKMKAKPEKFTGADNSGITNLPAVRDVDKQAASLYRADIWNTKKWTLPQSDDLTYLQSLVREQERREKIILAQQERRAEAEKQQADEEENRAQQAKSSNRKERQIDERILENQTKRADAASLNADTRKWTEDRKTKEFEETKNLRKWKNEHPDYLLGLSRQPRYQAGRFLNKAGDVVSTIGAGGWLASKAMNSIGSGLRLGPLIGAGTAILAAVEGVKKLGTAALEASGRIESIKAQLEVVAGSNASAESLFGDISDYARKSPFGVEQTSEMAILLKQSGVYASDLMDTLKMIGDTAGGNAEKMKRIANNYAQIVSIGKASMLDMRQFAYAGIPIFEAVSKELGVSQERLRTMISDGEVTSDIIEKVFKNLTGVNGVFENATEIGARTLQARIQNLNDTKDLALSGIGTMLQNVGNRNGTGGIVSGFVDFAEGIYNAINNWSEKHNIASNIEQIKNNSDERDSTIKQLQYLNDNKKALEGQGYDVKGLIDSLETRLKILGAVFSPDKEMDINAMEYNRQKEEKEKAQRDFAAIQLNNKLTPYIYLAQDDMTGPFSGDVKNMLSSVPKMLKTLENLGINDFSAKGGDGDAMQAIAEGIKPENLGEYFIGKDFIKRYLKLGGNSGMSADELNKIYSSILKQMNSKEARNSILESWRDFTNTLNGISDNASNAMPESKAEEILNKPYKKTGIQGDAYVTNKDSADKFSKSMEEAAKMADSSRSIVDRFNAEMKQSAKYQQEQREKEIKQYKEYNSEFERLTKKYPGNNLFSKNESYKGMDVSDLAKYFLKFKGRESIKFNAESYYNSIGETTDYGKQTWSYFQKTIPFLKDTLAGYFKEQGEKAPEDKAQEMLGDFTKILDIDTPTKEDFNKAAVWFKEMAENTESLSGDIRTVVQYLLMTMGNQEGQKLDLSYIEDAKGKAGDAFIPLWKRLLSRYTGISSTKITGTESAINAYADYRSTQSMAGSMLTGLLRETGDTKKFSQILAPKMTDSGVFSTKGTDGKEEHVYQADWKQVRANLKEFAFGLSSSSKDLERYKSALESEYDTYTGLLAAAYTTTEGSDVSTSRKYLSAEQLKKFSGSEAEQLFTDFGEDLKTEKGETVTDIRDGKLFGTKDGKLVELEGKMVEITGNINDVLNNKIAEKRAELSEASIQTLAKTIREQTDSARFSAKMLPLLYGIGSSSGTNVSKYEGSILSTLDEKIEKSDKVTEWFKSPTGFKQAVGNGDQTAIGILIDLLKEILGVVKDESTGTSFEKSVSQGARNFGILQDKLSGDESGSLDVDFSNPFGKTYSSTPFGKADAFAKRFGEDTLLSRFGLEGSWSAMSPTVKKATDEKYESSNYLIDDKEANALREQGVDDSQISILQDENALLEERKAIYEEIADAAANAAEKGLLKDAGLSAITDELKNLGKEVLSIGKETAKSAFIEPFKMIGAYAIEGSDAFADMHRNLKQLAGTMLQQVGTAMTTAGFNIAAAAAVSQSWPLVAAGLALAGAGGVVSGFGGALSNYDNDDEDESEDEARRLESLKDDLSDLLKQAREDAVYYESTLRHKKAISANDSFTTQKVNDAIITPSGNVISTHPDDYLIATKTPETLSAGRGGTPTVNFQLIDKSTGVRVVQQQASYNDKTNEIDYMAIIESKVQEAIASPKSDTAFEARAARLRGRSVVM